MAPRGHPTRRPAAGTPHAGGAPSPRAASASTCRGSRAWSACSAASSLQIVDVTKVLAPQRDSVVAQLAPRDLLDVAVGADVEPLVQHARPLGHHVGRAGEVALEDVEAVVVGLGPAPADLGVHLAGAPRCRPRWVGGSSPRRSRCRCHRGTRRRSRSSRGGTARRAAPAAARRAARMGARRSSRTTSGSAVTRRGRHAVRRPRRTSPGTPGPHAARRRRRRASGGRPASGRRGGSPRR